MKTEWLQRLFTMEEPKVVIKSFSEDKAPVPDGFNLHFFQSCWNTIRDDVWRIVEIFHQKGSFVKILNAIFIALIPKKKGAVEVKDFRPTSLLRSVQNYC
ncbi:hypothetical protein FXO38_34603 [Capsicum annuum]|uniref:Uncharacterized protein n=1 Tax=Capsicum annuum TaxID=4072 RepID=A0A2G2ZXF9_CAPAN|nr:hypothetical protein FXO38_34603 [Capsicum annuum]KAF3621772.1 hypothetical protein FXO37_32607 [Capsicum annuum]PHT86631.1 hypothetical protein T459_08737 [Capsicum annuum]